MDLESREIVAFRFINEIQRCRRASGDPLVADDCRCFDVGEVFRPKE